MVALQFTAGKDIQMLSPRALVMCAVMASTPALWAVPVVCDCVIAWICGWVNRKMNDSQKRLLTRYPCRHIYNVSATAAVPHRQEVIMGKAAGQGAFDFGAADRPMVRIVAGRAGVIRQAPRRDGYVPVNLVTGQAYTGGNVDALKLWHIRNGFGGDYRYCTLKQANEAGYRVRAGASGCALVRAMEYGVKVDDGAGGVAIDSRKSLRRFVVFHISQLERDEAAAGGGAA